MSATAHNYNGLIGNHDFLVLLSRQHQRHEVELVPALQQLLEAFVPHVARGPGEKDGFLGFILCGRFGLNLLPEKFTLPEIHLLYETLLGKELSRRNFPQKLLSLGLIEKLDEQRNTGAHRSPYRYRFVRESYAQALREGLALVM